MKIIFSENGWEDYLYWQTQDKKTLKRVNRLIQDITRTPFEGIGQPEGLRYGYQGLWSRRINSSDRLIYSVNDDYLRIYACKGHYD